MAIIKQHYEKEVRQCDRCGKIEGGFSHVRNYLSNGESIDLCVSCVPNNQFCEVCGEIQNIRYVPGTAGWSGWEGTEEYLCKKHYKDRIDKSYELLMSKAEEYNDLQAEYKKF